MEKVVIFDFDGTLANIEPLIKEIYRNVSASRGWPELTDKAYQDLRRGTINDAIKWIGVRPWQIPNLMRQARNIVHENQDKIELFDGVDSLLHDLKKSGWQIYILSANSTKTIHHVLKREKLDNLVTVLKRPALFGKATSINSLVRKKRFNKEHVWMVGDEVRDIDAANKSRVRSVAVIWGLQHESLLVAKHPTVLVKKVKDIESVLNRGIIAA